MTAKEAKEVFIEKAADSIPEVALMYAQAAQIMAGIEAADLILQKESDDYFSNESEDN